MTTETPAPLPKKPVFSLFSIIVIILFSALSAIGGLLKIPSPVGSIAFDSAPGYFCAAYFFPLLGGIVGFIGHLASAMTAGFPLGLNHLYIAVQMFLWCYLFGLIARALRGGVGLIVSSVIATVLNGVGSPLLLTISPFHSLPLGIAKGLMPVLLFASAANVLIAGIAYKGISRLKVPGL